MLVMAAVMIPVFLLLTALVVDVGNWYTHKRQLQNRADAAAFAAGVEYARNWKACVQTGDAALRASTGAADRGRGPPVRRRPRGLRLRRRHAAGDAPEHRDREPGEPRRRHQLERPGLHRRHRLHRRRRHAAAGNPCYMHPTGRRHLPAAATGRTSGSRSATCRRSSARVGLPLSRNGARARDRDPPRAQRPPVPAARRAEQRDHEGAGAVLRRVHEHPDAARDAGPRALPTADQGRRPGRGHALGPPPNGTAPATRTRAFPLTLPTLRRLRPDVPADRRRGADREPRRDRPRHQTCAQLLAMQYADCFHRLSQIRIWNDGNADNQVRIGDVRLTGGCEHRRRRRVLRHPARRGDRLRVRRARLRQLGRPRRRQQERPRQLQRQGQRRRGAARRRHDHRGRRTSEYAFPARAHRQPGRQHGHRARRLGGRDHDTAHVYQGNGCRNGGGNPCRVQRQPAGPPGVRRHAGHGGRGRVRAHLEPPSWSGRPGPAGRTPTPPSAPAGTRSRSTRRSGSAPC